MEPKQGERVKLFFRNGLVEEGIVDLWTQQRAVLRSFASENVLVIQNTEQDIIAIKIYRDEAQLNSPHPSAQVAVNDELKPDQYYKDEGLRVKSLAELRLLQAMEERKRAREATRSFTPNGLTQETYDPLRTTLPRRI